MMRPIGNNANRTGENNPAWRPSLDRFFERVDINPESGCLLWKGFITRNGYPRFSVGRRSIRAHRFIYEHCVGEIPYGMGLDPLWRTRHCVNPTPLDPVTRK